MRSIQFFLSAVLALASTPVLNAATASVTVKAGEFDRTQTVVTFPITPELRSSSGVRVKGRTYPVQVNEQGAASFVLDELKKGASATLEIVDGTRPKPNVFATRDGAKLKIAYSRSTDGTAASPLPLIDYQAEPGALPRDNIKSSFERGGYLHPIRTLTGKVVTDDFPPNHIHHHGVWWAWTSSEFDGRKPDFWNMGDGKGRVEFVSLDGSWSGPVHAGFRSKHRFIDLTAKEPVNALDETWEVTVYAPGERSRFWVFDLVSRQRCATSHALKLPEYRYGGMGVRGNWVWNGRTNAAFLTSDGETDRIKGHATRGRWCDIGGLLDGDFAGLAILCHPDNFRAPQPMRIHPDEPFFNFAPQQAGDMAIAPEETYVSRYRFVVHDGRANKTELDRLWNDYAHPPVVTVQSGLK